MIEARCPKDPKRLFNENKKMKFNKVKHLLIKGLNKEGAAEMEWTPGNWKKLIKKRKVSFAYGVIIKLNKWWKRGESACWNIWKIVITWCGGRAIKKHFRSYQSNQNRNSKWIKIDFLNPHNHHGVIRCH